MGNTKLQYVQGTPMFTDINKNKKQYPYLTEDIETDICIIGGGVTGAITSYYLSKENIKCVLLEKRRIALRNTPIGLRPKKQDKTRVLHHVPLLKD